MKTYQQRLILVVFLLAALFAVIWLTSSKQSVSAELSFTDIDNQTHVLSDYRGKPVLVIFWATDCPGCIQEMPELIKLHQAYADKGLEMIGVAMAHDTPEQIKAMRTARSLPYTLTWDNKGDIATAFNNVRVTPTHFLIAPDGEIIMRKIGALNMERLTQDLQAMGI